MLQVQNVKKVLDYKCKLTIQISLSLWAGLCYRTIRYHNNIEVHNWTCLTDQLLNRIALKAKNFFIWPVPLQNSFFLIPDVLQLFSWCSPIFCLMALRRRPLYLRFVCLPFLEKNILQIKLSGSSLSLLAQSVFIALGDVCSTHKDCCSEWGTCQYIVFLVFNQKAWP